MLTTDVHGPCPKITSYPRNPSNLHSVNVGLFSREGVLLFRVSSKMKIRLASEPVLCSLPLSSDFHFATLSAQQNFFPGKYYLSLPMWASYKVLPLQRSSFHCFCIRSTFVGGLPLFCVADMHLFHGLHTPIQGSYRDVLSDSHIHVGIVATAMDSQIYPMFHLYERDCYQVMWK